MIETASWLIITIFFYWLLRETNYLRVRLPAYKLERVLFDATSSQTLGTFSFESKPEDRRLSVLLSLAIISIVGISVYLLFRGTAFLGPGYGSLDRLFAVLLLAAECFLAVHALGYLFSVIKASRYYKITREQFFSLNTFPPTAVVVATYNEAPDILEDTLASLSTLDYPAKKLYILDDSTNESLRQRIEELANRYGVTYMHRKVRRGYKAGATNDLLEGLTEKYLAVFDADQKPVHNFLDQVISLLEEDHKLAFVQTPQFYENTGKNAIAFGSAYQQVVFYEYICEGKSISNAMFSCGSNVVYRVEALRDVGGFEEASVTEDFATGFKLHLKGWKSLYYNYVFAYGLGPESLGGYFTQQMRWALGTLGLLKHILVTFLKKPWRMKPGQWWEYALSGSYYWVGWTNLILILCPIAFILFDIMPLIANPVFYLAAFVPYFAFSLSTFYFSLGRRGYPVKHLVIGQSLSFNSFWVLMNAAIMALFNIRRPFGVTPKGVGGSLKVKYLMPQIILITLSFAAVLMGIYKVWAGYGPAMIVNIIWASYHVFILSMVFYFNREFRTHKPQSVLIEPEL